MKGRAWALASLLGLCVGCSLFVRPVPEAPEPDPDVSSGSEGLVIEPLDRASIAPGVSSSYWDRVRAGEPLVVGVNPEYPPFGVRLRGSRGYDGFDVELARRVGEVLGVEIELREVSAARAGEALVRGEIDLALAGITRTASRAGVINFTRPYLTVSQAALVNRRLVEGSRRTDEEERRGTLSSYADLAGVSGLRIGASEGTRPYRLAVRSFPEAEVIGFPSVEAASRALIAGQVDALVHDAPYVRVWSLLHPGQGGNFAPLLAEVTRESICMGVRKGDLEFVRWLDVLIAQLEEEGVLEAMFRRHFENVVWADQAVLQVTGSER